MNRRADILATISLIAATGLVGALESVSQAADLTQIILSCAKREYVLGQPVVLDLEVKNTSGKDILVCKPMAPYPGDCPDIVPYIARSDLPFRMVRATSCNIAVRVFTGETLKAGESWCFELRPYYIDSDVKELAFPRPGEYRVKFQYPLWIADAPNTGGIDDSKSGTLESNVVTVEIVEPKDVDAKVWQAINSPDYLYFLQWGAASRDDPEIPFRAAELLKKIPDSSYHSGLRWALKTWYENPATKLNDYEAELVRSVTGIQLPPPQPFPEDKRLDQMITYHFPKQTPMEEVFREISQQTGVPLQVDPSFRAATMASLRVIEPLRRFMQNRAAYKAEWVPHGKGYLIKVAEEGKDNDE